MARFQVLNPHSWITTNGFFYFPEQNCVVKAHRPKKVKNKGHFYKYRLLRLFGFPIPYEIRSEAARASHERTVYQHWHARGFNVPRLMGLPAAPIPDSPELCLSLEYIEGADFAAVLSDPGQTKWRKLKLVGALFDECNERHRQVFETRDRLLIKYDGNFRNIIVRDDKLYHIDFECGRVAESLHRGAAREIGRYVGEAVKFAPDLRAWIITEFFRRYRHPEILKRLEKEGLVMPGEDKKNSGESALNETKPFDCLAEAVRGAEIRDEYSVTIPIPVAWEILRRAGYQLPKLEPE